jgi:SSS family solute:Na+ symporter
MKATLGPLDLVIVGGYILLIVGFGLWISRGIRTGKDYFLAGRSLPWWAAGFSLVVSDIGAKDMVGLAADGYRVGIVMMNFDFVGCIFPVLVAAFLFMPFLWLAGVYTVPEYLGLRFNGAVRTFFTGCWILFMLGTLAAIFVSAASMFDAILGWNFWFSVGITAVVVGIFTVTGGLKAVVFTEVISCIILIIGAGLLCILGLVEAGGWEGVRSAVDSLPWTKNHFDLLPPADHPEFPWPAVLLGLGFVLGPAYWIGNQAIVQRTLGVRSQNEARASYVFCAGIKLFFPILLVLPGLIGLALFHEELGTPGEGWNGNGVLPLLVVRVLPTGVLGLVIGAFLAGVLSNIDSYVNSASTMVVTDIYKPFIRPAATDKECLAVGRWLVAAILLGGVGLSYFVSTQFRSVFEAFQTFLTFFQGPLLALLLLGMLTRWATPTGGLAGMIAGVGLASVLNLQRIVSSGGVSYLWVAWWSFVVALVAGIGVSFVTQPHPEERLRGLVAWLPKVKEEAR